MQTFADQAAIAIESSSSRLALAQRNEELSDGLERERATSDVLRIISKSPGDVATTLPAIASAASRLCDSDYVAISFIEDGVWQMWNDLTQITFNTVEPVVRA